MKNIEVTKSQQTIVGVQTHTPVFLEEVKK